MMKACVVALAMAGAVFGVLGVSGAAELRVLGTGAVQHSVIEAIPGFEKETGHKVIAQFGTAKPDISTPEKLKALLLSAPSFAYGDPASGATTGVHFAKIIEGFGIGAQVKERALLRNGGLNVMKEVAEGKAMYGLTQSSEILAVKGTEVAGYLPETLQLVTVYRGQVGAKASDAALARRFLEYLAGPKGAEIFAHHGFESLRK